MKHIFDGEISIKFELDYLLGLALKEAATIEMFKGRNLRAVWDSDGDYLMGIIVTGKKAEEQA